MKWQLKHYTWLLMTVSTIIVAASLVWNIAQEERGARETARVQALAYFSKDQAFRQWATMHGGVYVPVTDETPPNPHLGHIPDRNLRKTTGQRLTLMNPAYMVRQINELCSIPTGAIEHLTSLKPLRPENAPDAWERKALQAFERGQTEVMAFTEWEGEPVLRLMRPMVTEQGCLKCHGLQGYEIGDIRGGMAITLLMRPMLDLASGHKTVLFVCHIALWVLMLLGVGLGGRRINQGIIQRQRVDKALEKSEEKFHMLFDRMLDGFALHEIILDEQGQPVDYRFLDVNPSFERLTGLTKEAILGKTVLEVLPGTETRWIKTYGDVALGGESVRFENFSQELDRHFEILAFSPRPGQFASIFLDVTERKRIEVALQEANDRLEHRVAQRTAELSETNARLKTEIEYRQQTQMALQASEDRFIKAFHNAPVLVGISRLSDGRYLEVNRTFSEKTGFGYGEAVGRTSIELGVLDVQNRQKLREHLVKCGRIQEVEVPVHTKNGDTIDCLFSAEKIDLNDEPCIIAVVQDITERKQIQQQILKYQGQLRSLASKLSATEEHVRKKAATILHDSIGQNLVSCRLLLGAQRQADLPDHLGETFDRVMEILEQVTEETKELTFDLASPTLYKLGLIAALEEWLTETIRGQYGIETCLENRGGAESLDETLSVMAFRSIKEISFNAVKHARANRIDVYLEMVRGRLMVTVLDDGIGFDYQQIETGATGQGQYGLFSIRERIGYMGGQLEIETAPGRGTRVALAIPVPSHSMTNHQTTKATDYGKTHTLSG